MSMLCIHRLPAQPRLSTPGLQSRSPCLQVQRPRRDLARDRRRGGVARAYFTVRGPASKGPPKQQFICKDCGYIYEGKQTFDSLDKSYRCPVCSSPKRRFAEYSKPVERNANATANRKARKEAQKGPDITQIVIFGCAAAALLVGLYATLNAVY